VYLFCDTVKRVEEPGRFASAILWLRSTPDRRPWLTANPPAQVPVLEGNEPSPSRKQNREQRTGWAGNAANSAVRAAAHPQDRRW
jgi:hypothetical protein